MPRRGARQVRDPDARGPDRQTIRRRWGATASRTVCPTGASSSRGPTAVNDINELAKTPPDFGVYIYDPQANARNRTAHLQRPNTWELNAIPVVARAEPPVIGIGAKHRTTRRNPATIGSVDIKKTISPTTTCRPSSITAPTTAISDFRSAHGAVRVRVIEGFSSEAAPGVTMFGLTMDEGAAILGEATVYGDGAGSPTSRRTSRCTSSRSTSSAWRSATSASGFRGCPARIAAASAATRAAPATTISGRTRTDGRRAAQGAQNFVKPVAERQEYPWDGAPAGVAKVQQFLTAKCATCHNDTQNGSGAADVLHRDAHRHDHGHDAANTASRTSSFSTRRSRSTTTARSTPGRRRTFRSSIPPRCRWRWNGLTVMGDIPPPWGVPESARESVLIEKINVKAPDGTFAWDPQTHPSHPEDVGVTITDEERADARARDGPRRAILFAARTAAMRPTPAILREEQVVGGMS